MSADQPDGRPERDELRPSTDAAEEVAEDVLESDPSGNTPEGLAGGMGVSSEITGDELDSSIESTHGAQPTWSPAPTADEAPPEQSPDTEVGGPETPTPEDRDDYREHPFDPGTAQPHSHG